MTTTIRKTILAGLALTAFCGINRGMAQKADSTWSVVASGGGGTMIAYQGWGWQTRYDSVVVTYTVGETCIAYDAPNKEGIPLYAVTEGFQQPDGYGIPFTDPYGAIGSILFYPNPCRQFSFVNFQLNESFTPVTMKVFSMDGKQVYTDTFTCGDGTVSYQLPTDNMAPGMYVVEIVGFTHKRYVGKLMVIPQ